MMDNVNNIYISLNSLFMICHQVKLRILNFKKKKIIVVFTFLFKILQICHLSLDFSCIESYKKI